MLNLNLTNSEINSIIVSINNTAYRKEIPQIDAESILNKIKIIMKTIWGVINGNSKIRKKEHLFKGIKPIKKERILLFKYVFRAYSRVKARGVFKMIPLKYILLMGIMFLIGVILMNVYYKIMEV